MWMKIGERKIHENATVLVHTYADDSPDDFSLMGTEDLSHCSCGFRVLIICVIVGTDGVLSIECFSLTED